MLPLITVVLTFLPTVVLLSYFYLRDKNREPRKVLSLTLLYGGLTFIPVLFVELFLAELGVLANASSIVLNFYDNFVNVALPEESFKLLVILLYASRTSAFDEPMDGLVYGAAAALGFATIENIFYVLDGGIGTAITRAVLSVPSHTFWGVILGYSVAQVKFNRKSKWFIPAALLITTTLHGLFNFFLLSIEAASSYTSSFAGWAILGFFHVLFITFAFEVVWVIRKVNRLRKQQEVKALTQKTE